MTELEIRLEVEKHDFRWQTMKGKILTLQEMSTGHIFNAMKMIYNHLANSMELPTIWFVHQCPDYHIKAKTIPSKIAKTMLLFIYEIEKCGDLPDKYKQPYSSIIGVIMKILGIRVLEYKPLLEGLYESCG